MSMAPFSISNWNHINYLALITQHGIYFDRRSYDQESNTYVYSYPYSIDIDAQDLKQPSIVANTTNVHKIGEMEELQCKDLARCNQMLYFVYNDEPVIETGVHPFTGRNVYIVGSGVTINTGLHMINCNGSGLLASPMEFVFGSGQEINGIT